MPFGAVAGERAGFRVADPLEASGTASRHPPPFPPGAVFEAPGAPGSGRRLRCRPRGGCGQRRLRLPPPPPGPSCSSRRSGFSVLRGRYGSSCCPGGWVEPGWGQGPGSRGLKGERCGACPRDFPVVVTPVPCFCHNV